MTTQNEQYDVVLANGRVIDPETYLDGKFNVGINGGQIAAVSDQPLKGKEVIDVSGMIVSPGFIDPHAHGMNIPSNRIQAFDGLTTSLELEGGILPVGEFYDNCAKEGRPINYGAASGWGYARCVAMNPETAINGQPSPHLPFLFNKFGIKEWTENVSTEQELAEILERTEQGLKEGGIGIGVLHGYAPGAGPKELLAIWQLAAKYNVPTYTHIQHLSMVDPNSGTASMIQLMGLAAATGAHTHVCHWNSTSLRDIPIIREIVRNAQAAGLKSPRRPMYMVQAIPRSVPRSSTQRMWNREWRYILKTSRWFGPARISPARRSSSRTGRRIPVMPWWCISCARMMTHTMRHCWTCQSFIREPPSVLIRSPGWMQKATGTKARTGLCPKGCRVIRGRRGITVDF